MITRIQRWLAEVVIGFNFCPFAQREFEAGRVRYRVVNGTKKKAVIAAVTEELQYLDNHEQVETTLLVLADGWRDFYAYLALLETAQEALDDGGYAGIYQLASFHPEYLFDGEDIDDPSHYTNRSPFPLIHILREASIARAVADNPDIEQIPERNSLLARSKGLAYWQTLLAKHIP